MAQVGQQRRTVACDVATLKDIRLSSTLMRADAPAMVEGACRRQGGTSSTIIVHDAPGESHEDVRIVVRNRAHQGDNVGKYGRMTVAAAQIEADRMHCVGFTCYCYDLESPDFQVEFHCRIGEDELTEGAFENATTLHVNRTRYHARYPLAGLQAKPKCVRTDEGYLDTMDVDGEGPIASTGQAAEQRVIPQESFLNTMDDPMDVDSDGLEASRQQDEQSDEVLSPLILQCHGGESQSLGVLQPCVAMAKGPMASDAFPQAGDNLSQLSDADSTAGASASTVAAGSSASAAVGSSSSDAAERQLSKDAEVVRHPPPRRDTPRFGCAVTWQHRTRHGAPWADFDTEVSDRVERGYGDGLKDVDFELGGRSYKVTFDDMTQIAEGSRRFVRRFLQPPEFLRSVRHPLLKKMVVKESSYATCSRPHLLEDVSARHEMLAETYTKLLGHSSVACVAFPVPARRVEAVEEADVHTVVSAASLALWRLRPCHWLAHKAVPEFHCEAPWRSTFEELLQRIVGDTLPTAQHSPSWQVSAEGGGVLAEVDNVFAAGNCRDDRNKRLALAVSAISSATTRPKVEQMVARTKLARWSDSAHRSVCSFSGSLTTLEHRAGLAIDAALEALRTHERVAVVSAASAHQLGGGVLTGGRHALEEAICMQTTLYPSLARAREMATDEKLVDHVGRSTHIPEDGCIVSLDVEVIRKGTGARYAEMSAPKMLAAVLSLAMPNRNYKLPGYDRRTGPDYEVLVAKKFHAAMRAAIELGIEMLVVPECGCGVFMNDRSQVGALLGRVVGCFDGCLKSVLIVGNAQFFHAAQDAFRTFGRIDRVICGDDQNRDVVDMPTCFRRYKSNIRVRQYLAMVRKTERYTSEAEQRLATACSRHDSLADDLQDALHAGGLFDRQRRPVWVLNAAICFGKLGLAATAEQMQDLFGCAVSALFLCCLGAHPHWDLTAVMILDMEGLGRFGGETADLLSRFGGELHQAFPAMLHRVLVLPSGHSQHARSCFGDRLDDWCKSRIEVLTAQTAELRLREVFAKEEDVCRFTSR